MKKLIGTLLALTIISSCFALVGCKMCEWISNTTVITTEKRIPPSERDPILDELELNYSDNFNEYDIEFVKSMRVTQFQGNPGYDTNPGFEWAMSQMSTETNTFYKVNIDLSQPLYFISVYETAQQSAYFLESGGVVEWHNWHKFDDYSSIPEKIDDWTLIGSYAVYDCVVEKDILNDIVFNHSCKYYVPLTDGYSSDTVKTTYNLYETVVWADLSHFFGRSTPITVLHSFNRYYFYGKDIYKYYVDNEGIEYIVLGETLYSIQSVVETMWKK